MISCLQAVINQRNTFLLHTIPQNRDPVQYVSTLELCTCTHVRFNLFYSSLIYNDLLDTSGD